MQFQSDLLDIDIIRPKVSETTALGAAYISGLASKFFKDIDEIRHLCAQDMTFKPAMDKAKRNMLYENWLKAVNATRQFK